MEATRSRESIALTLPVSLAIHGVLALALLWRAAEPPPPVAKAGGGTEVELTVFDVRELPSEQAETTAGGGATKSASIAQTIAAPAQDTRSPGPSGLASPEVEGPSAGADDSAELEPTATVAAPGSVVGDTSVLLAAGTGSGTDRNGHGHGNGNGSGIGGGTGIGSGLDASALINPSLPPPPSKARVARLIYPSRHADIDEELLYIVELKVGSDGLIEGVRLVRGQNFHDDEKALDAVWRFRYDPARDDRGARIASTVVQQFHLNR